VISSLFLEDHDLFSVTTKRLKNFNLVGAFLDGLMQVGRNPSFLGWQLKNLLGRSTSGSLLVCLYRNWYLRWNTLGPQLQNRLFHTLNFAKQSD